MEIYARISTNERIDSTDTDNDGIPDVFEIVGMLTSNGDIITTDPLNPDSDMIAYHSEQDTWQRDFGYNDMYDDRFI